MNAQHTPGPWHVSGLSVYAEPEDKSFGGPTRQYHRIVAKAYDNELIGENEPDYRERVNGIQGNNIRFAGHIEAQSNASLISAAPELLEALEACLESGSLAPLTPNVLRQARNAIIKAKGQA
jgi:hypothetical protein